jgi:hypothetical protein
MKYLKTFERTIHSYSDLKDSELNVKNFRFKIGDLVHRTQIGHKQSDIWEITAVETDENKHVGSFLFGKYLIHKIFNNPDSYNWVQHDWDLEKLSKEEEDEVRLKIDSNKYNL